MLRICTIGLYTATVVALLAMLGWLATGINWLAVVSVVAAFVACAGCWLGVDRINDDIGHVPHPLDPTQEALRRRLAMGKLQDRAEGHAPTGKTPIVYFDHDADDGTERGW